MYQQYFNILRWKRDLEIVMYPISFRKLILENYMRKKHGNHTWTHYFIHAVIKFFSYVFWGFRVEGRRKEQARGKHSILHLIKMSLIKTWHIIKWRLKNYYPVNSYFIFYETFSVLPLKCSLREGELAFEECHFSNQSKYCLIIKFLSYKSPKVLITLWKYCSTRQVLEYIFFSCAMFINNRKEQGKQ